MLLGLAVAFALAVFLGAAFAEAFAEVLHFQEDLPFFKLKTEPSDKPDVQWIEGGFFAFSSAHGNPVEILVDPETLFGSDTSFQNPTLFSAGKSVKAAYQRTESRFGCAFSYAALEIPARQGFKLSSFYGQADRWSDAAAFRRRVSAVTSYAEAKRDENEDRSSGHQDLLEASND